jgi:hypothetical protein
MTIDAPQILLWSSFTLFIILAIIRIFFPRTEELNLPVFPDAEDHRNTILEGTLKVGWQPIPPAQELEF